MNTKVNNTQKQELKKARKIFGLRGYKIFTTRRLYNRSGNSFIALHKTEVSIYLLCPRKNRLEIRASTDRSVNLRIISDLRKHLSLPLRVGRRLTFKQYDNGKRFIVPQEHEEFEMLINDARL